MPLRAFYFAMLALLPALAGCTNPQFGLPTLFNNQSEVQQVGEAKRFDVYPDPNIGPPVVGGRPLAYLTPRAEPDPAKNGRDYLMPYPSASLASGGYPGAYSPPPGYYPGAAPYPSAGAAAPNYAAAGSPNVGYSAPGYSMPGYPPAGYAGSSSATASAAYPAATGSPPSVNSPPISSAPSGGFNSSAAPSGMPSYPPPGGYSNSAPLQPVYPLPGSSAPAASSGSFAPNVSAPAAAPLGPTAAVSGSGSAPASSGAAYGSAIKPMP